MLPVHIIQKSIIQFIDDPDNFSGLATATYGPNIYAESNFVSDSVMVLAGALVIATLLFVRLRKKNRNKLAATILAVPTAIAFIPAVIATVVAIIVAINDIALGGIFTAFSGFYLCLTSYVLWNTYKMYKGVGDKKFKKIAIATVIISVMLLILPKVINFIFNSMGVEATG